MTYTPALAYSYQYSGCTSESYHVTQPACPAHEDSQGWRPCKLGDRRATMPNIESWGLPGVRGNRGCVLNAPGSSQPTSTDRILTKEPWQPLKLEHRILIVKGHTAVGMSLYLLLPVQEHLQSTAPHCRATSTVLREADSMACSAARNTCRQPPASGASGRRTRSAERGGGVRGGLGRWEGERLRSSPASSGGDRGSVEGAAERERSSSAWCCCRGRDPLASALQRWWRGMRLLPLRMLASMGSVPAANPRVSVPWLWGISATLTYH